MPREGTRSQTGNANPRVFQTVDTAPVITRKKTTTKKTAAPAAKGAKPAGVTKKKAPAKKPSTATKVRFAVAVLLFAKIASSTAPVVPLGREGAARKRTTCMMSRLTRFVQAKAAVKR